LAVFGLEAFAQDQHQRNPKVERHMSTRFDERFFADLRRVLATRIVFLTLFASWALGAALFATQIFAKLALAKMFLVLQQLEGNRQDRGEALGLAPGSGYPKPNQIDEIERTCCNPHVGPPGGFRENIRRQLVGNCIEIMFAQTVVNFLTDFIPEHFRPSLTDLRGC
jgi:hypothetical protein